MFKKTLFQIHWFLGISAGLILSLMGVTGAIYSYEQQILKAINQDSYVVQAQQQPKLTPAELYQHFSQSDPDMKINSISIASDATASSTVNIVKEGARRGYNMMVNPYTAEVLPEIKGQKFFQFVQQLHRNLTVGPVGKQITGACTLMLIYFVLSGLYLRWPKRHSVKQWLAVKPKLKGRNFLWDLHAVVGTWVIVFYLILACTGLYWSYDWWRNGMFKVMGVERPQPQLQEGPKPNGQPAEQAGEKQSGEKQATEAGQARGEHQARSERNPATSGQSEHGAQENKYGAEGRGEKRGLKPEQVNIALTQSWNGFNQNIGREYSSVTFNIPKKANGELEINFVDAVPQHERARNKATYNYQTAALTDIELYEDKKLNEKIMTSMLPVHRGSFFGPIYQFFVVIASLMMPLFFVTGWMLYLKRRKQKKLTQQARQSLAPVTIDPNAQPWLICYASQTGQSEQLAWRTATSLQEARQPVTVKAVQQLSADDLTQAAQVLFVASTYGTGEAPDLASSFERKLMTQSLDLSHVQFAVLALGSEEYPDTFCSFGHAIHRWMQSNAAKHLFDTIEVNNGDTQAIQAWNSALAKATKLELQHMQIEKTFDAWTLTKRDLLNPNSLGAPAFNIELKPQHEANWQAGDIAEIQPGNSAERIANFMQKYQIQSQQVVDSTQQRIEDALWDRNLNTDIEPFANLDHLLEQLPPLPTREYSIASIPSQQVLRLVVRQQSNAEGELGLGSGWLTQHAAINSTLQLRIRTNESFHLIADNRPVICIGNGTGIAGLLSLLHARVRQDYTQNWLIFGERQRAHDFFYQDIIEAWQNTGLVQRIDLTFSRDQAEKRYVHHELRDHATLLKSWVEQGAVIYVCGSINGMATDVDHALIDILGEDVVAELRQAGRYRRDVY
ncbi:sulfite reductase flavoprotein subunit alpha [Acinetobacter sp. YH16042]|uniref:PepSY domain-containing protein n=1 Tax=Acinetobacter sp. YH16042 TaxID=2601186 RepID=UPI0015D3F7FD|nr:sulfite reductase flavoprotein subunit alpha [Acinetobacter sp. YH16042]